MARNFLRAALRRHQSHEQTFVTRVAPVGIPKVEAGQRILKDGRGLPRRANRAPVASLFDEVQLKLEYVKDISIIYEHGFTSATELFESQPAKTAAPVAVTGITVDRDGRHFRKLG